MNDGSRILDSVFSSPAIIRRLAEEKLARQRGRRRRAKRARGNRG